MLECPVCRQPFDGRFKVMVPPSSEAFDSIACARQAALIRGLDAAALTPVVLPTLTAEPWERPVGPTASTPRKGVAALAALLLAPSQAALAGGVGLATAGSAAAIYLAARPAIQQSHPDAVVTAMPAPGAPTSKPSIPAARPATRPPLRPAVKRPLDAGARKLVVGRRSRPPAGYAVVGNVVPAGRPTRVASHSTNTQLVSRTIPASSGSVSTPAPVSKVAPGAGTAQPPAQRSTPTPVPKPRATPRPRPHVSLPSPPPAASGATSKASNTAANAATRQLASADATPPKGKKPEPPVVQAAAAANPLQDLIGDDGQLSGDHGTEGQPVEGQGDSTGSAPAPETGGHTVPTTP